MSMPEELNVVVCVPSNGTWMSAFGHSLAIMFADFMLWRPTGVRAKKVQLQTLNSSMLVQSRHDLVRRALRAGATHILFLDSDMVFEKDLLQRLIMADKDVVGVNCTIRAWPVTHIAHDLDGQLLDSRGKRGLEKVQHVGLAVMLIKASVFHKLTPPFFMMEWIPEMKAYCGEDVYFCQVLQAAGIDVWIDHELSKEVHHVGVMAFGQDLMGPVGDSVANVVNRREKKSREIERRSLGVVK